MAGIKSLVGRKQSKTVKFMGEDVEISKLSVSAVVEIQAQAKKIEGDDKQGFEVLKTVVRSSVKDASDLTDEEFNEFPLDELSKLSNQIMEFSGIGEKQGK